MNESDKVNTEPFNTMIDIECLGRRPFCPLLSIGACVFRTDIDPEAPLDPNCAVPLIADVFYVAIDLQSCLDLGLKIDADTLAWWMEQTPEARKVFTDPNRMPLPAALDAFTTWANSRPLIVWGNSARFDLGITEAAYTACGKSGTPWEFRNERCYRTIKNIPEARSIECPKYGTHHNALDDAIAQALHLAAINKRLNLQL